MKNILSLLLVLVALTPALMGSNCNPNPSQDITLLNQQLDIEAQNFSDVVVQSDTVTGYQNRNWEGFSNAFMEWAESFGYAAQTFATLKTNLASDTEQNRNALAGDLAALQQRIDALLTRQTSLSIVVEPWTAFLINKTKNELLNELDQMRVNYPGVFNGDAAPPIVSWSFTLTRDTNPTSIYPFVDDTWNIDQSFSCVGGDEVGSQCPIPVNTQLPLRAYDYWSGGPSFLHQSNQTIGVNLNYTSTRDLAVTIEKKPGATGTNLMYNEPVALKFNGGGYLVYHQRTDGAVDLTFSQTPSYEWAVMPKWSRLNGLDVDRRVWFALRNLTIDRLLMPCNQTFGVDLGWNTSSGNSYGDIRCQ